MVAGGKRRDEALRDYGAFSADHRWKFESLLWVQRLIPRVPPRALAPALRAMTADRFTRWAFDHYLRIAPAEFAGEPAPPRERSLRAAA